MDTSKKKVITGYKKFGDIPEKSTLVVMGDDSMEAQDGYHTFGELYEHRIVLWIALCRQRHARRTEDSPFGNVWRSQLHGDGSKFEGWFVLGIGKTKGTQITYHLPLSYWKDTAFAETLDKAPDFDGHTPEDVLAKLKIL